jgi:hypothetical protein
VSDEENDGARTNRTGNQQKKTCFFSHLILYKKGSMLPSDDTINDDATHDDASAVDELAAAVTALSVTATVTETAAITTPKVILCDAGYGFPSEARPRREKMLAVAKQLVHFLHFQQDKKDKALVKILGCNQADVATLKARMEELYKGELPEHVEFSTEPLNDLAGAMYLSPDAPLVLEPSTDPPSVVIVGMLIDRRVQVDRSHRRANALQIPSARLALEHFNINDHEPLNVDVCMEVMQQWWWNGSGSEPYMRAAEQALRHHVERHPNRPLHK